MLKHHLTIALRHLLRRKGSAFINVFGLAIGLAACLLIGLYVQDEMSYDAFHENADRAYRVLREFDLPDLHATISNTPSALAPALTESVPAVEAAVRVSRASPVVQRGAQTFVESNFLVADAGFFDVFSFPIQRGAAALDRANTVVLSEAAATKYFPAEDPIGQTLRVGNDDLEVTGIMANVPANSHLQFDFVGSFQVDPEQLSWGYNNYVTYVLLADGASKEAVTPQVAQVIDANTRPEGGNFDGHDFIPHLQPLTGIHFGQGITVDVSSQGNILYVYLFVVLVGFILLLACINFMNLATARAMERAKEVGMRKTVGAGRGQLAAQFLGESLLMSLLALILALFLCELTLPLLNQMAGKELTVNALFDGPQVLALLGLVVLVGLVAGSYPAFVLSRFRPAHVLRGLAHGPGGDRLRKGLVVFQFAISIALIAGTGIVQNQLRFMKSAGLGFDEQNVVVVEQVRYLGDQVEAFKEELDQLAGVQRVASGFSLPGTFFINSMWQPVAPNAEPQNMDYSFVDFDYLETLGIDMVAGRSFSLAFPTDSSAVVLNERAVSDFGWSADEAVGQRIKPSWGDTEYTVIGVAKDFHFRSLHAEIYPLALFGPRRAPRYVAARVAPGDPGSSPGQALAGTLTALRSTWEQFSDLPFEYAFLADDLAAQYRAEDRLVRIFSAFTLLAVVIACLGLFGLAAYAAERRTKEIGIRKVLGASVAGLVALLSKDFVKLVLVAFVVAVPVAYLVMNRWLDDFAYRIDRLWPVFLAAGVLALVVALLTVSYQAIRAALADPVKSLRYE